MSGIQLPPNATGAVVETFLPTSGLYTPGERQVVSIADGGKATYSASYVAQSVGTSATTAIFGLVGSATKTVRLVRLIAGVTIATAGEEYDFLLQKESVLPTGGTLATVATIVPWDSADGAATAVPRFYTATPTDGTVTGILLATKLTAYIAAATTVLPPNNVLDLTFGREAGGHAIVLRGATQGIFASINLAAPAHASAWTTTFVWTEE